METLPVYATICARCLDRKGRRTRRPYRRAVPVWERTHRAVEGLLVDGDPDRLRDDLRALS
jgi:hypothetical protein